MTGEPETEILHLQQAQQDSLASLELEAAAWVVRQEKRNLEPGRLNNKKYRIIERVKGKDLRKIKLMLNGFWII